jgi:hypothetical protein
MTNPGPTKEKYDSLIYKLAILETQLKQPRKLLEAPAKAGWWKRFWGRGSKAVVALMVFFVGVGCATLSNIQESPPVMVLDSPCSPEKVANCIADKGTQAGLDQSRVWSVGWAPPTIKKSGDDYRILVVGVAANPLGGGPGPRALPFTNCPWRRERGRDDRDNLPYHQVMLRANQRDPRLAQLFHQGG